MALHVLHVITCFLLVHPERLRALYAPYTPCQVVFFPPNEASLTQTSPATAHLVPCPPTATDNWLARNCAASNQVPEFTRPNPRAPGFLAHFWGSYSRYWCPANARLDSWGRTHSVNGNQVTGCSGILSSGPHPQASWGQQCDVRLERWSSPAFFPLCARTCLENVQD